MQLIRAAFVIVIFHHSLCHPDGAPASTCENMTPSHGSPPQTSASPYKIKITKEYYMPGENVRVSIESSSDDIRGYFIQARQVGTNAAIGTFATLPANGKYVNCGNSKGAITHSARLAVKTINFEWVPPSTLSGNVVFYATVVKDFSTFWVNVQSPQLPKKEMATSTQPPSSTEQENVPRTSQSIPATRPETNSTSISMMTGISTSKPMMKGNSTSKPMMKGISTSKPMMKGNSTSITMTSSTSGPKPTAKRTCKPDDPKCNGAKLSQYNFLVLFLIGLIPTFWQI